MKLGVRNTDLAYGATTTRFIFNILGRLRTQHIHCYQRLLKKIIQYVCTFWVATPWFELCSFLPPSPPWPSMIEWSNSISLIIHDSIIHLRLTQSTTELMNDSVILSLTESESSDNASRSSTWITLSLAESSHEPMWMSVTQLHLQLQLHRRSRATQCKTKTASYSLVQWDWEWRCVMCLGCGPWETSLNHSEIAWACRYSGLPDIE